MRELVCELLGDGSYVMSRFYHNEQDKWFESLSPQPIFPKGVRAAKLRESDSIPSDG